jgi:hypothetical protein
MSILDQNEDKEVQFTPLSSLNIDSDDCRNIRDFYSHFGIEMTPTLKESIDDFENALSGDEPKEKLVDLQNRLRANLCESITNSNHPFFRDHLMEEIRSNAQQIAFLSNFDQEVQKALDAQDKPE